MEKIKSNFSQTAQNFSQMPLKNMVYDKALTFQNNVTSSRMPFLRRFLIWFIIIILLSLYGLNIFTYLAEGTDIVTALISPFLYVISLITGDTLKSTIENTSQGGQTLISGISNLFTIIIQFFSKFFTGSLEVAENSSVSAINQLQTNISKDKINSGELRKTNTNTNTNTNNQDNNSENNDGTLSNNDRTLNERTRDVPNTIKNNIARNQQTDPIPLQSNSSEHGYCYIGTQSNVRNCAKVTSKNKCMSGDIFPTMDLCINPTLRN
jgi:hypothetical protein